MFSPRCLLFFSLAVLTLGLTSGNPLKADEKKDSLEGGAVRVLEAVTAFDTKAPNFAMTYRIAIRDLRDKLGKAEAQDELMKKLPTLSTQQLVVLWDGFWLESRVEAAAAPLGKLRDLDDLAKGFAVKFNTANIAALAAEKDATRQRLYVNMISQQQHTLTKEQVKEWDRLREKLQKAGK